jgi:hypothetical protein
MVLNISEAASKANVTIDSISQGVRGLSNFNVPALPCGIDSQIFGIQSEITNAFNTLVTSFAPSNLINNLGSLKLTLKTTIADNLATIITDQLPGKLPLSLVDDVYNLVQACSLSPTAADCTNRLNEVINRYSSLGVADGANLLLSILNSEGVDICSAIPNIQLFEDGTEGTFGLPAKLGNNIPEIANIPHDLVNVLEVKANSVIDKSFVSLAENFSE